MNATATTTGRAVPEWLETPTFLETEYLLAIMEGDGNMDHSVDMTRAEFIELKRHLAGLRGFDLEGAEEAAPDLAYGAATVTTSNVYGKEISEIVDDQIAWRLGDEQAGAAGMEPGDEDRMVFYMMLREVQDESEKGGTKPRLLSWAEAMERHARRIRAAYSGGSAAA